MISASDALYWSGFVWASGYCSTLGYGLLREQLASSTDQKRSKSQDQVVTSTRTNDSRHNASTLGVIHLIRPCAGNEPGLAERLTLLGGATRVTFCIASADDQARTAAEFAVSLLQSKGIDAELLVTHANGPNRKAAQLAAATSARNLGATYIACVDSDVRLSPNALLDLTRPMETDSGLGATWSPVEEICDGLWGREERPYNERSAAGAAASAKPDDGRSCPLSRVVSQAILNASPHAFRFMRHLDGSVFVGKLFAIRSDLLAQVGGFEALTSYLGEDLELAHRVRGAGFRYRSITNLGVADRSVSSLSEVAARFSRWQTVIKQRSPHLLLAYPLLFAALPWATLVLPLALGTKQGGTLLAAMVCMRLLLALALGRKGKAPGGQQQGTSTADPFSPVVLAELTLSYAWLRTLISSQVSWRGETLRVQGKTIAGARAHVAPTSEKTTSTTLQEQTAR
jgi:ceramide glucosyltransferase